MKGYSTVLLYFYDPRDALDKLLGRQDLTETMILRGPCATPLPGSHSRIQQLHPAPP